MHTQNVNIQFRAFFRFALHFSLRFPTYFHLNILTMLTSSGNILTERPTCLLYYPCLPEWFDLQHKGHLKIRHVLRGRVLSLSQSHKSKSKTTWFRINCVILTALLPFQTFSWQYDKALHCLAISVFWHQKSGPPSPHSSWTSTSTQLAK